MRSTHHQSEVPDPITRPVFITVDHLRDFYPIEYIHYYIHCSLAYHQPSSISANLTRPLTPPPHLPLTTLTPCYYARQSQRGAFGEYRSSRILVTVQSGWACFFRITSANLNFRLVPFSLYKQTMYTTEDNFQRVASCYYVTFRCCASSTGPTGARRKND